MLALNALTLLSLVAGVSSSQTPDCSYSSLLTHLKMTPADDALQIMRPVKNWTTPTVVKLDMVMYGILHVDEKSQTVESHVWIQMNWVNEFLTWNSSDFCGISRMTLPRTRLWLPDVAIQEDASDTGSIFHGPFLYVTSDGFVSSNSRQRLTSTCEMNLLLFPFDTQHCKFTFGSMTGDGISLGSLNNESMLSKLSEAIMVTKGEWELDKLEIESSSFSKDDVTQERLVYMITMSRKPLLYVINLIVPLLYLLVLDLASFFISESRGEKLGFKVTILLSISVLLLILQDMLPSTENIMPFIAIYCVAIFAVVGLSVLEAMLVSFLVDLDDYFATMTCCSAEAPVEIELEDGYHKEPLGDEEEATAKPEKGVLTLDGTNILELLKLILGEVKAARRGTEEQRAEAKKVGRYKRMAEIIDHIFFVVYFLTVMVFLTYMYIHWIRGFYL